MIGRGGSTVGKLLLLLAIVVTLGLYCSSGAVVATDVERYKKIHLLSDEIVANVISDMGDFAHGFEQPSVSCTVSSDYELVDCKGVVVNHNREFVFQYECS